jgi:hypothetical protein
VQPMRLLSNSISPRLIPTLRSMKPFSQSRSTLRAMSSPWLICSIFHMEPKPHLSSCSPWLINTLMWQTGSNGSKRGRAGNRWLSRLRLCPQFCSIAAWLPIIFMCYSSVHMWRCTEQKAQPRPAYSCFYSLRQHILRGLLRTEFSNQVYHI